MKKLLVLLASDVVALNPCADTDEQSGPWATGTAHAVGNDNDLGDPITGPTLTRTNSFGNRGQGTVYTNGETWHYSWVFRAQIDKDGNFVVRVPDKTNLKKLGN